jgi:hypothetical protein
VRPLARSEGHDAPGLVDELVLCLAAVIDEIVVGFEDTVGEPVVAHELPDVLYLVEFGAFRWQGDNGDVGRHNKARRRTDPEKDLSSSRRFFAASCLHDRIKIRNGFQDANLVVTTRATARQYEAYALLRRVRNTFGYHFVTTPL